MEQQEKWLPITHYAAENRISISTIRRKIKSNSIEFKLVSGRYLIKAGKPISHDQSHSDTAGKPIIQSKKRVPIKSLPETNSIHNKIEELSKKVAYLEEQNAELDMVVRMFEEKLDSLL